MQKKKFMKMGIVVLVMMILLSGVAAATDGFKNIRAQYRNIKVVVNNVVKTPTEEPFLVDGRTYVPLRFISEALGADVDWNGVTNTVTVNLKTADPAEVEALKAQVAQKDNQIIMLQIELDKLKKEADKASAAEKKLEDLEKKLNKDYSKLKSVTIDSIELEGDEDEIDVFIEVDLDKKNLSAWSDLSDSNIKKWIENIVKDIQKEYSNNTEVTGVIYDTREREDIIEFEKDGKKSLKVDFWDDDYRNTKSSTKDVEKDLTGMDWKIDGIYFTIEYIKYSSKDVTVELVYDDKGSFGKSDWNKLDGVEDDIEDLCIEIIYEFEDNADVTPRYIYVDVFDDDWNKLDSFEFVERDWSLR